MIVKISVLIIYYKLSIEVERKKNGSGVVPFREVLIQYGFWISEPM